MILLRIRKSLSLDLAKQIAVALVSSKLNYCNPRFYNIPEKDIARLQRVQNCLARVVTNAPRFSHSTPILKRLHWLPVKFRIHFKICTITFLTLKPILKRNNLRIWLTYLLIRNTTLVPRATLRGMAELHVASGNPRIPRMKSCSQYCISPLTHFL